MTRRKPSDYLTGARITDAVLPAAQRMILAAHANDKLGVDTAFADAELEVGDALTAARALAVVLAAMCPDDLTPERALEWRKNVREYRRLRSAGVSSREAAALAAAVVDNLWNAVKHRETSCPQGDLPSASTVADDAPSHTGAA